jgi:hypothetical protein
MEEFILTLMLLLPDKVKKGYNSKPENVVKSEIKPGVNFMVLELVHKFQMIHFKGKISY